MRNSSYPKAWARYVNQVRTAKATLPEVFFTNRKKLPRWSARFRLAKSFKAMDLGDEYAPSNTPRLYSSITRIFLVYSAFETYCGIFAQALGDEAKVKQMQDQRSQHLTIQRVRELDPEYDLPKFLMPHLNPKLKRTMQGFMDGQAVSVSFLAKCIRHIFAHGILAAHSSGLSARKFEQISQVIADFLLDCMDEDFDQRVPPSR